MSNLTVNYMVRSMERMVSATFAYGETSMNNPYFTVYFVVNNSGVVAVYDKSTPLPGAEVDADGNMPYLDELKSTSMPIKQGLDKYEILRFIHGELTRIGEKLQQEGRELKDSDINKLMTKVASKYEGEAVSPFQS